MVVSNPREILVTMSWLFKHLHWECRETAWWECAPEVEWPTKTYSQSQSESVVVHITHKLKFKLAAPRSFFYWPAFVARKITPRSRKSGHGLLLRCTCRSGLDAQPKPFEDIEIDTYFLTITNTITIIYIYIYNIYTYSVKYSSYTL